MAEAKRAKVATAETVIEVTLSIPEAHLVLDAIESTHGLGSASDELYSVLFTDAGEAAPYA